MIILEFKEGMLEEMMHDRYRVSLGVRSRIFDLPKINVIDFFKKFSNRVDFSVIFYLSLVAVIGDEISHGEYDPFLLEELSHEASLEDLVCHFKCILKLNEL